MGAPGLVSLLQRNSRTQVQSFTPGQATSRRDSQLLIDTPSLLSFLLESSLGGVEAVHWQATDFHASLYSRACVYLQGLQRTGLQCICFAAAGPCGYGPRPGSEASYVRQARHAASPDHVHPPTAELVLWQAIQDLGLPLLCSRTTSSQLLLAWYWRNRASVFGALSADSDLLVHCVQRVMRPEDVVIDTGSVTLHVWDVEHAWKMWHLWAAGTPALPALPRRAQLASLMGSDLSADKRQASSGGSTTGGMLRVLPALTSPHAASKALLFQGFGALDLAFFQNPPLSTPGFSSEDLAVVNAVAEAYQKEDQLVRGGNAVAELAWHDAESAPQWVAPHVAARLVAAAAGPGAEEAASVPPLPPGLLLSLAARGLATMPVPEPHCEQLRSLRAAVATQLLAGGQAPPPGPAFEYDANTGSLYSLTPGSTATQEGGAAWFRPAVHLPGVPVADVAGADGAATARRGSPPETAAALQEQYPGLQPSLAALHALLLHAVAPEPAAWSREGVRELLLPGVPLPAAGAAFTGAAAAAANGAASGAAAAGVRSVVDVGSSLSSEDWADIDNKEVIGRMQAGPGFTLMMRMQAWDPASAAAAQQPSNLPRDQIFKVLYFFANPSDAPTTSTTSSTTSATALAGDPKLWKKLCKACFETEYAALKEMGKSEKKAWIGNKGREALIAEMKGPKAGAAAAAAAALIERLQAFVVSVGGPGQTRALLALRRDAAAGGPGSIQWTAMQVCWAESSSRVRAATFLDMWGCDNGARSAVSASGAPMRYPHQQQVVELVQEQLDKIHESARTTNGRPPLPLHLILSTPTGSGKTFTAVMMARQLLRPDGEYEGYPDAVLVYSVPTKQVLKRVGQECEAHKLVYWTAATDGERFQVRRPYSIRTKRGGGSLGAGDMKDQLEACAALGKELQDIGGGRPQVIIADIHATAALVRVAAVAGPEAWYHRRHIILYFDEPNMGIHMDERVAGVVRDIMAHAPSTTILASATLPSWDRLPAWWKGNGAPAVRGVITQEPYELPMAKLSVLDCVSGQLAPVNPLDLFDSYRHMSRVLEGSTRSRVLLLRHFTPSQCNQLTGLLASSAAATGSGSSGGAAAAEEQEGSWSLLGQDVRALRECALEAEMMQQDEARFTALRSSWREAAQKAEGLRDVLSKQGVTMIATLQPRRLALEIAGRPPAGDGQWAADAKTMRAKVKAALAAKTEAEKQRQRATRRKQDDDDKAWAESGMGDNAGLVALRPGLSVDAAELDAEDDDTLVMLSKGVAYASCDGVEPLVKRLYQQALIYMPERSGKQPPLSVLVVDYSAVYGTDCQAVDTLVLCPDLGTLMSWEDHLQFMGRLRRDGTAIYPSYELLRFAVLGGSAAGATGVAGVQRQVRQQQLRQVEAVLSKYTGAAAAAAGDGAPTPQAAAASDLAALVCPGRFSRGAVASAVLSAVVRDAMKPVEGAAEAPAAKAVLAGALARFKTWGGVRPLALIKTLMKQSRVAEQVLLVSALQDLCLPPGSEQQEQQQAALPVAVAARLLQELAEGEYVTLPALQQYLAGGGEELAMRMPRVAAVSEAELSRFHKSVQSVVEWLEESSEEESEDEDE